MPCQLDQIIAFHCAPVLAGIKPANLVSLCRQEYPCLSRHLQEYNQLLNRRGIYFELLRESPKRGLLLVYRADELADYLALPQVKSELNRCGYPIKQGSQAIMAHLKYQLAVSPSFPHEMGLFLGYPVEDVLGFVKHGGKNFKLNGYWKVYVNASQTLRLFQRYDECRQAFCLRLARGMSIAEIFSAA